MRGDAARIRFDRRRVPFEFAIPAGALTVIIAALFDSGVVAPPHRGARIAVMAAAVAIFCAVVGEWRSGLATALVGYLLLDGFLLNRHGELTWDHTTGLQAVTAVASAGAAGLLTGWLFRRRLSRSPVIQRSTQNPDRHPVRTRTDTETESNHG
jgi:hypothetical protein